jgi:malate permease and related proteins
MPLKIKFIIFQILIILPFITGIYLKKKIPSPSETAKKIISINLIFLEPIIIFWSIWGLNLKKEYFILPLSGLFIVISGMILGKLTLPFLNLEERGKSTFLISSSIVNHGFTMGIFLCYLFIGEEGLGLGAIFILYFMPFIFIVIFPYARRASNKLNNRENSFKQFFLNFQNMPIYAGILAILFYQIGIKRPDIYFPVDFILILVIVLYYFTLGINFNFNDIKINLAPQITLGIIKFLAIPLIVAIFISLIEMEKNIKSVILIQSFMPAAIYSVMASILFDLDSRLASGLFVVNTVFFLLVVLPVLFFWVSF